jgi:hypothetical protein
MAVFGDYLITVDYVGQLLVVTVFDNVFDDGLHLVTILTAFVVTYLMCLM